MKTATDLFSDSRSLETVPFHIPAESKAEFTALLRSLHGSRNATNFADRPAGSVCLSGAAWRRSVDGFEVRVNLIEISADAQFGLVDPDTMEVVSTESTPTLADFSPLEPFLAKRPTA